MQLAGAFVLRFSTNVPGAKAHLVAGLNVRDKSRTYLRNNGNDNSNGKDSSKGKDNSKDEKEIPFGDDNKKCNDTKTATSGDGERERWADK